MTDPTRALAWSLLALGVSAAPGCAALCLSQQHRGEVTTLAGTVGPGEVTSVVVPYDRRGSQNDLRISWNGQEDPEGPRPAFYLTDASCDRFEVPRPGTRLDIRDPCSTAVGRRGGIRLPTGEIVQTSLAVAGGPEQGPLNADRTAYTLHVVGDARRPVTYRVVITWFRGPDC